MRPTSGRRRYLVTLTTGGLLVLGGIVGIVVATASSELLELSPADVSAVGTVIESYERACEPTWPPESLSKGVLSAAAKEDINAAYRAALDKFCTTEYLSDGEAVDTDLAYSMGAMKRCDGYAVVDSEVRVLDLKQIGQSDSDIIIRARIWVGESRKWWDEKASKFGPSDRLDTTPVLDYRLREVAGRWKIVSRQYSEFSEDDDVNAYGPDTPHSNWSPRD